MDNPLFKKSVQHGFNHTDIWRYGGWLLPNTNVAPNVPDEQKALNEGAVKFDFNPPNEITVERKKSDRHTEARMTDFMKKFPPPETLNLKFKTFGQEEEDAKLLSLLGSHKKAYSESNLYSHYEGRDDIASTLVEEYAANIKNPKYRQRWSVIPAPRLKKIWNDYAKMGFVRDEKGIEQIALIIITNIHKIEVNNILTGHTSESPSAFGGEILGQELPEDYFDQIDSFFDDDHGQWRISDYAADELTNSAIDLRSAKSAEEKLQIIDHILNIVHQRSDIASWFVEGGSATLGQLAGTMDKADQAIAQKVRRSSLHAVYVKGYAPHAAAYIREHGDTARHVEVWAKNAGLEPGLLKEAIRAISRTKIADDSQPSPELINRILQLIKEKKTVTTGDVAKTLNISHETAYGALVSLRDTGLLGYNRMRWNLKFAIVQKVALNIPKLVKDFGQKLEARYKQQEQKTATAEQIITLVANQDTSPNKEYTAWIVGNFTRGTIARWEDIAARVIPALKRFHTLKITRKIPNAERDIGRIKDLPALEDLIEKYRETDTTSKNQQELQGEQAFFANKQVTLVHDDPNIKIVIPHTKEAAQYFGCNTRWCTSALTNNMFEHYNKDGSLYIVLIKAENQRYQFHFPTDQFMDDRDMTADTWELVAEYPILKTIFGPIAAAVGKKDTVTAERLAFIDNPSEEFMMRAVQSDGRLIKYFPNASEEMKLVALGQQLGTGAYEPRLHAFIVQEWDSVEDFAKDTGDHSTEWAAGVSSGDTYIDSEVYDAHENMHQALQASTPNTLSRIAAYLKFYKSDDVVAWLAENDDEQWSNPKYVRKHLADHELSADDLLSIIEDRELDEEQNMLLRGYTSGAEAGTQGEVVRALKQGVLDLEGETTAYGTTFRISNKDNFWESPIQEILTIAQAQEWVKEYPEEDNLFEYVRGDNTFTFKLEQPYNGYSGWDDEACNSTLGDDFSIAKADVEARKKPKSKA